MWEPSSFQIGAFDSIELINSEIKSRLKSNISNFTIQLQKSKIKESNFRKIVLTVHRLIYFPLIILAPIIYNSWINVSLSFWSWLGAYIVYFILYFLLIYIVFLPFYIVNKFKGKLSKSTKTFITSKSLFWILPFVFVLYYILSTKYLSPHYSFNFLTYALGSSLFAITCYSLVSLIELMINLPVLNILYKRRKSEFTQAVIVDRLISVLKILEDHPTHWGEINIMDNLIENIEYISEVIHHNLFKNREGGFITKTQMQELSTEIASGVREIKNILIAPSEKSREKFISIILNLLIHITLGNWGELPKSKQKHTYPKLIGERLKQIFRIILIASIPLLLFQLIQMTPLSFSGDTENKLKIGSFIWAVLYIMTSLDPTTDRSFEIIKTITKVIP